MNTDNLKEVQLKTNKMISKGHFKEQCSWLSNKHSTNYEKIDSKEIEYHCKNKEEYLELLSKEIQLLFISEAFTKREKKQLYELTIRAFWEWQLRGQKK